MAEKRGNDCYFRLCACLYVLRGVDRLKVMGEAVEL